MSSSRWRRGAIPLSPIPWPLKSRLLSVVIPFAMLLVAGLQHVRATTVDQSSWSGAGFGMFATYESELTRFVTVSRSEGGRLRPVALPRELERQAFEARVVPDRDRLAKLASGVRSALAISPEERVRIEVWGISYQSAHVTTHLLEAFVDPA